jgi:SAM-dependent methyltransferase
VCNTPELRGDLPNYGNWVPLKLIYVFGGFTILFLGFSFVFAPMLVGAALFCSLLGYFAYARFKFSSRGGDLQGKVRQLVLDGLEWEGEGKAIDIGCGDAPLTIELARKFPSAHVVGIDYWGGKWDYSKKTCEGNARIQGVSKRVSFQKASASALPFDDGYFDAAVSNLVFHEVSDTGDKRQVVREALRVVKKGGRFAFQDLFLEKRIYGELSELLDEMKRWGVQDVQFIDTSRSDFVPRAFRLNFMLGSIGIINGTK